MTKNKDQSRLATASATAPENLTHAATTEKLADYCRQRAEASGCENGFIDGICVLDEPDIHNWCEPCLLGELSRLVEVMSDDGTRKACDIPQCLNNALPDADYCGKHNAQGTDKPYGGRTMAFTASPRANLLYRDAIRGFDALLGEIKGDGDDQKKTPWVSAAWHRRVTWLRWLRELKCYVEDKETMANIREGRLAEALNFRRWFKECVASGYKPTLPEVYRHIEERIDSLRAGTVARQEHAVATSASASAEEEISPSGVPSRRVGEP